MTKAELLLKSFSEEQQNEAPKHPNGTPDVHGDYLEKSAELAHKYMALETELMAMAAHFKIEPSEILSDIAEYINNDNGSKLSIVLKSENN